MSTIDTLASAFAAHRGGPSEALKNASETINATAIDPKGSIESAVAAVRAAGISKADLNAIHQNIATGSGTWESAGITARGRLASVISRIIERDDAFASPPMRRRPGGFEVPVTTLPVPPQPKPGITIGKQYESQVTALDRKYMEAFEKAGIVGNLTGARNTLTAGALQAMVDTASNTKGLSLREFLIDIVIGSAALGFEGITANSYDNAAAVLIAASEKQKAASEKAGKGKDVDALSALVGNTIDKENRSKAEIAGIYRALDAIYLQDSTAAAPELRRQLTGRSVGRSLQGSYDFHLSYDATILTADPHIEERPVASTRSTRRGSVVSQKSAVGGRELMLVDDTFAKGRWESRTLRELVAADPRFLEVAVAKEFDLDASRDVLVVQGKDDPHPIYLVFSKAGDGVLTICKDCAFHDFTVPGRPGGGGGGAPIMVRKPVIYIYPQTAMTVRVQLEVAGKYVAQYPKMNRDDGWEVRAQPNGDLLDPRTEKTYAYLFWEAERAEQFVIDESKASLVARESVVDFLDKMASAYQLTPRERTDFVSYWMAPMQANAFSMVQFLDVDYTSYAKMRVTPEPDSIIRMFMVFKAATGLERVGNPSMPTVERRGFTVVEWGGANLDEQVK